MTDREMLELAAKAAGISGRWVEKTPEDGYPAYSCGIGNAGRITPLWNPLTDDGDALRLAVKLNILDLGALLTTGAEMNADPYDAVRRAIVMAAAELTIG